jgi:ankyrin repeat protein
MSLSEITGRLFKPSLDEQKFFAALANSDVGYVTRILKHYPAVSNRIGPEGRSPLNIAVDNRSLELCKLLVAAGANLEHRDPKMQMQPLNRALHTADAEIADLLIDKGADVNAPDALGQTPIYMAAGGGPFKNTPVATMQKLVQKGAKINVYCHDTTPLMLAAMAENDEAIKFLVGAGADVTMRKAVNGVTADQLARSQDMKDYLSKEKDKQDKLEAAREKARKDIEAVMAAERATIQHKQAENEEVAKMTEGTRGAVVVQKPLRFRPH